jgi:hypothetical protein
MRKYPGLVSEKIHPGEVSPPIFGLAMPMEKYVVCGYCRRGYVSVGSWRSHVCEKADMDLNSQPPYFLSLVQTFFRGPRLCYFPIKTPTTQMESDVVDDFALFKSQFPQVDIDEVVQPEDYRELNQFLSKEGWVAHVAGCSKSELSTLTSLPQCDEFLAPVGNEVFLLMSNIQSIIGNAGFHVRRLLGKRPS